MNRKLLWLIIIVGIIVLAFIVILFGSAIYNSTTYTESTPKPIDFFELSCEDLKSAVNELLEDREGFAGPHQNEMLLALNYLRIYELKGCN